MSAQDSQKIDHMDLTTQVVAAYVRRNPVPPQDVERLIESIAHTFDCLKSGTNLPNDQSSTTTSPTREEIKASIRPYGLVSFENGQSYQILKRHLTSLGLTPDMYRAKWGLPPDYPMVSPNYSERQKDIGLGLRDKRKG
ncbi:MucR family transcriptional regulator [Methylobacterium sp.]|uniref:MucR family transcriptional regulator n=1 Tax=Methylobacterium sp. TaxID=409 RepID=UPI0025F2D4EC|nr:MucR family transcriptional regulator [Methylobacterium sp.]